MVRVDVHAPGLTMHSELDDTTYEKITDREMRHLETQYLTRHEFHGDGN